MKEVIRAKMTANQIAAIQPSANRRLISDETVANLYLAVEPTGTKTWRYDAAKLREKGRIKLTLGRYPAFGMVEARAWATARNDERDRGDDPRALEDARVRAAERAKNNTVAGVFATWITHKRVVGEALRSLYEYERMAKRNVLCTLGQKPINEVTKADVRDVVRIMRERGATVQANRVLTLLNQFLDWCSEEDYVAFNVARELSKTKEETKGSRALTVSEMALAYRAAELLDEDERDAVRLLILTGGRKMEALGAASAEYRVGLWMLPIERSKSKREWPVLLGELARPIFEERADRTFLFHTAPHRFMMASLGADLAKAMATVGGATVAKFTLHGIRKGVRSALESDEMDEMGEVFPADVGERVLNHSVTKLNATYNASKHQRLIGRALAAWERLLRLEIDKQTGANVRALRA